MSFLKNLWDGKARAHTIIESSSILQAKNVCRVLENCCSHQFRNVTNRIATIDDKQMLCDFRFANSLSNVSEEREAPFRRCGCGSAKHLTRYRNQLHTQRRYNSITAFARNGGVRSQSVSQIRENRIHMLCLHIFGWESSGYLIPIIKKHPRFEFRSFTLR